MGADERSLAALAANGESAVAAVILFSLRLNHFHPKEVLLSTQVTRCSGIAGGRLL